MSVSEAERINRFSLTTNLASAVVSIALTILSECSGSLKADSASPLKVSVLPSKRWFAVEAFGVAGLGVSVDGNDECDEIEHEDAQ